MDCYTRDQLADALRFAADWILHGDCSTCRRSTARAVAHRAAAFSVALINPTAKPAASALAASQHLTPQHARRLGHSLRASIATRTKHGQ